MNLWQLRSYATAGKILCSLLTCTLPWPKFHKTENFLKAEKVSHKRIKIRDGGGVLQSVLGKDLKDLGGNCSDEER